jgi:hypothetical protein
MAGGTAGSGGSGAWNMHGAGMGLGPPGGFGPVPPEYSAAMSGGFNTQPAMPPALPPFTPFHIAFCICPKHDGNNTVTIANTNILS